MLFVDGVHFFDAVEEADDVGRAEGLAGFDWVEDLVLKPAPQPRQSERGCLPGSPCLSYGMSSHIRTISARALSTVIPMAFSA